MAVSGLSGIESMLQQMRAVVSKAETGNLAAGEAVAQPDGFAAELHRSIRRVTGAQLEGLGLRRRGVLGAGDAADRAVQLGSKTIGLSHRLAGCLLYTSPSPRD